MSSFPIWLLPAWLICMPVVGAIVSVMIDGTRDRDTGSGGSQARYDGYLSGTARARTR